MLAWERAPPWFDLQGLTLCREDVLQMCQADVVMWLGKELRTPNVCQLGVRLCDPLSLNDLSLCTGNKVRFIFFVTI